MISALKRQEDGSLELTITIPQKRVKSAYDQALADLAKKTELKGFRKGKAPKKLVEEKVGKSKVQEELLKKLITQAYIEAVKEQDIKPVTSPKIKLTATPKDKDWQFTATTCELPKVTLGNYQSEVKKAMAAEKIWVPGKDKEEKKDDQTTQDQRLQKIFQFLLKTVKVQIPSPLLEDEINRMLSRLIDQTGRLGITVEQYLTSVGKTQAQIRQEYQAQAERSLKLELILSAIAEAQKIQVSDQEVEKMVQAAPDEASQKAIDTPAQRAYIKQLLRKRTVIDNLLKL